jgi:phosphoribosylformimino-5-aminoimidazole carboxamide ribotide isomerase
MRIIPAIDIIEGKCVRLTQGDYSTKKVYDENPLEVAKRFEAAGIQYLHLVDLDGAKSNRVVNHAILEKIATQTKLIIDFGGGIKRETDVVKAFDNGANQITAGSVALKEPLLFIDWVKKYGNDKIILGADCKNRKIVTNGWLKKSEMDVIEFIESYVKNGLEYVISTDVEKDGMLQGASVELYKEILSKTKIKLIASGGVNNYNDLMLLKEIGCEGAIIGKAIYEGKINLKELSALC